MIHLRDYLYEAELNLEWWNSKSPAYQKRYLSRHPNSIYAQKAKSGELDVKETGKDSTNIEKPDEVVVVEKPQVAEKYQKKKEKLEQKIKDDEEQLNAKYVEFKAALEAWRAIPDVKKMDWDSENHKYVFETPEDEETYNKKVSLKNAVAVLGAEIDIFKHRIELAQRGLKKLHRQVNFEQRAISPNASTKYKSEGVAEYIDFAGMDKDSEDAAVSSVVQNIQRYPFMKGHLTFLGSHKSGRFKLLTDQLATDFYIDQIQKEYDKSKAYYDETMKGYHGQEKDPSKAYQDISNWDSPAARDLVQHRLYTANEAYAKMERIEGKGGPEGYVKTPTYQNAINKWRRMRSRNWAFYRPDQLKNGQQGMIVFNENKFDDAEITRMVEIKWHPEGCASKKATMDHEFGHAIWYQLGLDKVGTPNVNGNDSLGRSPLQRFISSKMYMGKTFVKNNLSEYAATNSSEFFAEAYSEYLNNPNPRAIAQKIGELLDQEIESRGYKK